MQVEVLFIKIECIVVPRRTPGHRVFRFTSKLEFCLGESSKKITVFLRSG